MKKNVLFLFLLVSTGSLFGQTSEDLELPNFTPPSPTAYELGKYGELPIGLFTGSPNVSIPLVEYKTKNISIPISLSYSSNGIKVDQLATKVGLGWSIFAGGTITRTVNQNPDELRAYQYPNGENYTSQEWLDYFFDMTYQPSGSPQPITIDGEPDIFSFNFLGRTGRFTYNNQMQIVLLDNIALKITYNPEGNGGFLITDENGIKYYFQDTEETRLDTIGGQSQYNSLGLYMVTAWNLTRIETLYGEIISFQYEDENYNYVTTKSQSVSMYSNPLSNEVDGPCDNAVSPPTQTPVIDNILLTKGKRISQISSNNPINGSIHFQYNTSHPEVSNYSMLSSLDLKDESNNVIEQISLSYNIVNQRMFLNDVTFLDPDKKYTFEYTDLHQFPQRLSFSKDHWGYYNGKANSRPYPNLSGPNDAYGNRFHEQFPNGANREIDESKAKKGLLKKVTYPTKGYTEIEYESNDYRALEEITSQENVRMVVTSDLNDPVFSESSQTLDITNVAEGGMLPLDIFFDLNYQSCPQGPHPAEADRKLFIEIENLTNPSESSGIINRMINQLGAPQPIANSISLTSNDIANNDYFFKFHANHNYRIKISVFYQCLWGELKFKYSDVANQSVFVNKKTGGLRVSKTTNFDSSGETLSMKKYYYASKDNLQSSSGDITRMPNYYSYFWQAGSCFLSTVGCGTWKAQYIRLGSQSLNSLYRFSMQTTRYKYVTVSEDSDDFSNGGIEHEFKMASGHQSYLVNGVFSEINSEGQRSWGDGFELEKTYFKQDNGIIKNTYKEINNYSKDSRENEEIYAYKISRKFVLPCRGASSNYELMLQQFQEEFDVTKYYLTQNWVYLSSKTMLTYDLNGENPVSTSTNYFYDNPEHAQITRTEIENSKGEIIKNTTKYPQDISSKTSAELKLISQNRIGTPIEVLSYKKEATTEELINRVYNEYFDWGNNIVEIIKVQTSKEDNVLEDRVEYHDYDNFGNPIEVSKTDGSHIHYVWGYDNQYPIAKIENVSPTGFTTTQQNFINAAKTASNNDVNSSSENALRTALNNLRNGFLDAMVTTYTYDPLIGVTSITAPSGNPIYYEYDTFNRLKLVRDQDNNIVSKNEYHYKN